MIFESICLCGILLAGAKSYQKLSKNGLIPSLVAENKYTRQLQLKEISSLEDECERKEVDKKANRDIAIASGSFGLSIIGSLFYAPLGPLSMVGMMYINRDLIKSGYRSLIDKGKPNVGLLVASNSILFFVSGYYVVANLATCLWSCYTKLLTRIEDNSKRDFIDVFKRQSRFVWVLFNGIEVEMPFESLKSGDIVVIHAGESIPIDGFVTDGTALVDQHILTGESQPAEKGLGDEVLALTVVLSGQLHVHTEKTGDDTTSAKIGQVLNEMVDFKTHMQLRATEMADKSIWPTLLVGGISYPFFGPLGPLIINAAMPINKLLIPASFSVLSTFNKASKNGILIKDGRTLELLKRVDTVVFDKTGTLTQERPHVVHIYTCNDSQNNEVFTYAAAAEEKQNHPIAKAIQEKAFLMQLPIPEISEAEYKIGYGITVTIDNKLVRVGSFRFIEMEDIPIPAVIKQKQTYCHKRGNSFILVAVNNEVSGAIELQPTVRPEAKAVIDSLRLHHGIKSMAIISGDQEAPTRKLAEELGITNYFAQVLPQDKAKLIAQLQEEGKGVCYVGDGINDAIALKQADVSVSLSGASTVATDTAQVILMDEKLDQLEQLFYIAKNFDGNMKSIFATVIISSLMAVGGGLFLHLGLAYAIVINEIGFMGGIGIALYPLLQHNQKPPALPNKVEH
ncbi:MAG TPA: heavy metal translocating P-type ATPase [Thioploca sp.]|nr:heavy metal translocating P-type ATPase [Thioploca sp.]